MRAPPLEVLVVEDDASLREVLVLHLGAEGFAVRATGRGDEALRLCAERAPDVVVLDLSLPGRPGLDICGRLRAELRPSPGVIMVTARAAEVDVMLGFSVGADDYVVKPCRPREIVARVQAVARRVRPPPGPTGEVVERGPLRIDVDARRVTVGDAPVELTATEHSLLLELARAPDRVHTRPALLASVWETAHGGYARNVDCHVARVRRKLEAAGLPGSTITTVHRAGYRFVSPDAPRAR
jgi:DNA-binding response OmpR family regulator